MRRLWHRLYNVPSLTPCIHCSSLSKNTFISQSLLHSSKSTGLIFPLGLSRFYNANSLFNTEKHGRPLETDETNVTPKNLASLLADFHRSLATQDIDCIWPLYVYFYSNNLLHYLTRKNYNNLIVYTIRARASQKNLHRLLALVEDMKQRNYSLSLSEYNALINWVGGKTVPHKHSHHLHDALKIFDEMQQPYTMNANGEKIPKDPIMPTVSTFNTLIHIASQLSDLRTAQKLYHDMLARGLHPDNFTFCTLIHAMGKSGDVGGMDMMLSEMKRHGLNNAMKNTVIWNSVMSGYAMNGLHDRAYSMFNRMMHSTVEHQKQNSKKKKRKEKKKKVPRDIPKADAYTFKIYIDMLLKDNKIDEAIATLNKMKKLKIQPIVTIYNALFKSFTELDRSQSHFSDLFSLDQPKEDISDESQKKIDTIQKVYQHMKNTQVKPNSETMYTLVSAFLDLGDTKSALEVFVSLSKDKEDTIIHEEDLQSKSILALTKQSKPIKLKKFYPSKIEPRADLLERLNSIVKKKSV